MNVPDTVGVPLRVTTFDDQLPVTPAGKPLYVAPVAPVVVNVITGIINVLMHKLRSADPTTAIVLFGLTSMVPVADTLPQPPVKVTV